MSQNIAIAPGRQEELIREAASRQAPLTLNCRLEDGWTTGKSFLLGFDRSSNDLVVAYPTCPMCMNPEIVEGQIVGVSFRRAHRRCSFETTVTGRGKFSRDGAVEVPALRLEWPEKVTEMQRRVYYRTPVPQDMVLPVQVRLRGDDDGGCGASLVRCQGKMVDVSAGGVGLLLNNEDNPRWGSDTRVNCTFVAAAGEPPMSLYGHMRYLYEQPEGGVRMGVQFVGLETDGGSRSTLDQIIELTRQFQEIEKRREG